jgi:hypothetical protein
LVLGALLPGLLCNDSTIRISGEPTERQSEHDHEHNAAQSHPHYQQLEATMDDVEAGNVPTEEPNHSDENFVVGAGMTRKVIAYRSNYRVSILNRRFQSISSNLTWLMCRLMVANMIFGVIVRAT